ncbi:uncharacterized protein PHACADRAFT_136945 [Phanerochaete carnosa HHB-10118-sp]|uniref:GP-PDE domain-containing protein n=1 Tax=Phanerochaete carnosa (strain HHB-10118-sp) TaxID=650164 RepID=K5W611_PHACS|nr:uncharacterized protein PHACADRAFT_136945 [Phanerochaete carnosa HHB-10118-sp]EKM59343.1 hypothetical protein PHACADRAFT_136945 [Phanerochaete carnosa HHB-10118-sp]
MSGHSAVCRRLLEEGLSADALDLDNCTPMIYATLRGSVECVRVLLEVGHVSVQATVLNGDLIPLSLAARSGHYDVVVLLLQHGAPSLPNTNGEYPTHLAAQEGHHTICQLLVGQEGWDTPDKYNEWTPLFHAARYGHEQCLRVLLEAGSRPDRTDELENSAVHYAAWYGHHTCVSLLMEAKQRYTAAHTPISHPSPMSMSDTCSTGGESDIDAIPSLSLPPPMMPYRVYGHNYLDKNTLVQVSIGHRMSRYPESGLEKTERYLHTSPRLKLVVTASPAVTAAPFSISLPLADDERTVYTFQVPSIDTLSLEFSLYPNFGTKIVGRAASLPSSLGPGSTKASTLPIFDHRLHVIGEVSFEIITVTPFSGVTLEIGGAVETYWKAIASPLSTPSAKATTPRFMPPSRSLASAQTSPSAHSIISSGSHSLTHSSLSGSFFYITVQVTRDLQPVAYPEWRLPDDTFDLGVADVTLAQFLALAERRGRRPLPPASSSLSIKDIQAVISRSMVALSDLLKIIPAHLGVCLELAYPTAPVLEQRTLGHRVDLNDAVDAVLRTIYDITSLEGHVGRRNVVFTSFAPDVCAALNWKQPNYPVFFASQCGRTGAHAPSATALAVRDARDYRVSSLNSAVEVCKTNNLLGLLLDAEFLNEVPSLIQAVKDCGLLLGAFGVASQLPMLESNGIDAFLHDGVMTYSTRHY